MNKIIYLIIFLSLALVPCKNALHMFQQNRYEFYRYTTWLFNKNNIHFSLHIIFIIIILLIDLLIKSKLKILLILALVIIYAIYLLYKENNTEYIKDLVYTMRVKRQIVFFGIIMIIVLFLLINLFINNLSIVAIASLYLPYLLIYPLALLTMPLENYIKKRYENEARSIINGMPNLIKVGITGSFGKTTTKNVVRGIIEDKYYTLMTPASYNTPMGITRTIRENLKSIHEVFICEMGADHVGEITYLMDFIKPTYGILTAIGPQHLNTFKSIDNIIKEKFEIIEKLPKDGVGIINIDNEYIKNYKIRNTCKIITIGIDNKEADYVPYNISYDQNGTRFDLRINDEECHFETPLLGKHNIMNVLSGIVLAIELGLTNEQLNKAVLNVKRVEHRLELKKINGFTFIDNAFNSNPVSSKLSLDVLEMMPGKRIIVTPGLIDLGSSQDEYNYEFGKYMIGKCDFVLLIGEKQTQKVYQGLNDSNYNMNNVLVFNNVKEAFSYIYNHFSIEDTILLENDLPDAFSI